MSSNPVWNACIRKQKTFDDSGNPYNCSRWHEGTAWIHPDIPNFSVTWNERDPRGFQPGKNVQVVVLRPEDLDSESELLAAAGSTNLVN